MVKTPMQRRVQRITRDDLKFCTCGQCQVGDPVQSVDGGYLTEEVPAEAQVLPVITLPPRAELAAAACDAPLIGDAVRLAEWCSTAPGGRQVTATRVLRPAVAREAVEELQLWRRDPALSNPDARGRVLAALRSAGDLEVLDIPWQFAAENGFIAIRSGRAVPGQKLPGRDDASQVLACWLGAFEDNVGELQGMGTGVMPGMFGMMLGDYFGSYVFPILMLLYRQPADEWLDVRSIASALGADKGNLLTVFVVETAARLLRIFELCGAAEVDRSSAEWRADHAAVTVVFGDLETEVPGFRMRPTPLGWYGIGNLLAAEGHVVPVAGDLASADAVALLDGLPAYDPESLSAEVTGWLRGRDAESAVTQLLGAVPDADPGFAARRVMAITVLTFAKPSGPSLEILRETLATGSDGQRHVAAGVLASLGEEPASYRDNLQPWLLVDMFTAASAVGMPGDLLPDLLDPVRAQADRLWRSGHPAAADSLEAMAAAVRNADKALAKELRRSAHKARGQQPRLPRLPGPRGRSPLSERMRHSSGPVTASCRRRPTFRRGTMLRRRCPDAIAGWARRPAR